MEPESYDEQELQHAVARMDPGQLRQVISFSTTEPSLLQAFLEAARTDSALMRSFLGDIPPASEPVVDYITDLDERCDIFKHFQQLLQGNKDLYYKEVLNATALAVIMVAPISQLRAVLSSTTISLVFAIDALCAGAVAGMRAYLPKGRPRTGSASSGSVTPAKRRAISSHARAKSESYSDIHVQGSLSLDAYEFDTAASAVNRTASPGSSSITRSRDAPPICKERDGHMCIVAGTSDPEAAHIFPFATSSKKNFLDINRMLSSFWGQEKYNAWSKVYQDEDITKSPKNLISFNHQLHFWWDHAKFALKPLRKTEKEVVVQWHWLKDAILKPTQAVKIGDDFLAQAGLTDQSWGTRLAHRKSGVPIQTGQIFVIKSENPEHLPSFELLELQWDLLRVAAISGAAEAVDDDYDSSNDGAWEREELGLNQWEEDEDMESLEEGPSY